MTQKLKCQIEFTWICCQKPPGRYILPILDSNVLYFILKCHQKDVWLTSLQTSQWQRGVKVGSSVEPEAGSAPTTTELWLSAAASAPATTGQYLRHSSSCSWFFRRTGRRQPSTISTCNTQRVSIHSEMCLFWSKQKVFAESAPMSCPPFSSTARAGAGCCGKMPVSPKDGVHSKMGSVREYLKRKSGNESGKKNYVSSQLKSRITTSINKSAFCLYN